MKKLTLLATLISCVLIAQNNTNDTKTPAEKSHDLLQELVVKHKAMGAVAGISQGDSILWQSASGHMDFRNAIKANTAMRIRIASIAKPMTAIAVMQLFENGLIDLDEPIQTYINEFPRLENKSITIRQLLDHSSGIKGYASVKEAETDKNYATLTEAMNVFKDRGISGQPGEAYQYTTYGYVVLGVVIERVSGLSFEAYMKKNIWKKTGMNATGVEQYGKPYENKTLLYSKQKNGKVKQVKKGNNLSNRIPGGGLYSTLDDMLTFGQAVLNNTLIKPETLKMMLQDNGLKKEGNPYGLGWFMYGAKPTPERVFGHSGGQTGASSQLLLLPAEKKVIVVLCNTSRVWNETIGTAVGILNSHKKTK
ncbi:beta-lactamase family protein [Maribacter sp.]|nr:beta-lactamase family protein [Maribacter sp.]